MCIAAPGKAVEINGDAVIVDYNSNKVKADKGIVDVKVGDYVLVHAGLIIQVIEENEALAMQELFSELENL